MDIVHVKIPVAYGEGRYAFIRLQEEALKRDPDQTVFAWGCFLNPPDSDLPQCPADTAADSALGRTSHAPTLSQFMLAPSPREFQDSFAISHVPQPEFSQVLGVAEHDISQTFTSTPHGIRARLPLLNLRLGHPPHPEAASYTHLALLSVVQFDQRSQSRQFLALLLRPYHERGGPPEYLIGTYSNVRGNEGISEQYIRATFLSTEQLAEYSSKWVMTDVYIPHYPSRTMVDLEYNAIAHDNLRQAPAPVQFTVRLCGWSERLLELQDFACDVSSLQDGFHVFTISVRDGRGVGHKPRLEGFRILVGRCECGVENSKLGPLAVRLEVPSLQPDQCPTQSTHGMDHSDHVGSWLFSRGVGSRLIEVDAPGLDEGDAILLNLTLTTAKACSYTATDSPAEEVRTYLLGIEIHDPSFPRCRDR